MAFSPSLFAQWLGQIVDNTNTALPSSYNFKEYVFAEPELSGDCEGRANTTASIEAVFVSQTHRLDIRSPFMFTVSERPFLLQLAVSGLLSAANVVPDITVEGFTSEQATTSLGTLCMQPPTALDSSANTDAANFSEYYSVTIPKSWVRAGLTLRIQSAGLQRTISAAELNVLPYSEINLVMVNMDVLDYNTEPHENPIFDDFLQELAAALPASTVRFGTFPATVPFPEFVVSNNTERLVRLRRRDEIDANNIPDEGNINAVASTFIENIQQSTGDFLSTIYFGNTLNLAPGGWGGGRTFVGPDFTDIFIHELGHALSLPHWGEVWNIPPEDEFAYLYPYGGEINDEGAGRGQVWNFNQDTYEFESFVCQGPLNSSAIGNERSDAMQREFNCRGKRVGSSPQDFAPWDGFGDFSAYAIARFLVGAQRQAGTVQYRGSAQAYQLGEQAGFPTLTLENGERVFARLPGQPQNSDEDLGNVLPGAEQLESDVYLVYGNVHPTQAQANIVYRPIKYKGTLLPVIDPTDPATFNLLKSLAEIRDFPALTSEPRDITVRLTYEDGTIRHTLVPFVTFPREYNDGFGAFRFDVARFSVVVPADKTLCKVEVFKRPFMIGFDDDDTPGNINFSAFGITAQNFMQQAQLAASFDCEGRQSDDSEFYVIPASNGRQAIINLAP